MEEEKDIKQFFPEAETIILLREGTEKILGETARKKVLSALESMNENAVQMPAFGVSIDELTRKDMQKGVWLRLSYAENQSCFGMDFSELAFEVVPEYMGFNLCRLYEGAYTGRCFYLDLRGGEMRALYEVLTSL